MSTRTKPNTRTRKRDEPRLRARDLRLIPEPWKKHLVVLPEPCDFVGDVLPILPREAWARLDQYERGTVARSFVRYGLRGRLVLRGLLRGYVSPRSIAACAGVEASTVRHWKSDYDGFAGDYEIIAGLAGSLLERKQFAHGLSDRPKAQRATELWLKANDRELWTGQIAYDDWWRERPGEFTHERCAHGEFIGTPLYLYDGDEREQLLQLLRDFEREVLPALLPREEWERYDEEQRFALMEALAPHGLPQQLALRALVRGVLAPRNVAGAAGVTVATVNRWKDADPAFACHYDRARGLASLRMEEKLLERTWGDGSEALRAILFSLQASDPETWGSGTRRKASHRAASARGLQREREIGAGWERQHARTRPPQRQHARTRPPQRQRARIAS